MHDAATGLVYAQQRYYDPLVGKFLSIDPVAADPGTGGNFNRYWYANNNPYRFTDADGRLPDFLNFALGRDSSVDTVGPQRELANEAGSILRSEATGVADTLVSAKDGAVAVTSAALDRVSVNASAAASAGAGFQATKNIANGNDSVGFVPVGQGLFAGVSVDIKLISIDLSDNLRDSPLSFDLSADAGAGFAFGGQVSFDPSGKFEFTLSIGVGFGEHATFSPTVNVDFEER